MKLRRKRIQRKSISGKYTRRNKNKWRLYNIRDVNSKGKK
jgi:hypothetical protein